MDTLKKPSRLFCSRGEWVTAPSGPCRRTRQASPVFWRNIKSPTLAGITPLAIQSYLTSLRDKMQPITIHQHFRGLRTFFSWCVEAGLLTETPMRNITMKAPKTLPHIPEDADVRKLIQTCNDSWEGRRNKLLVTLLADSGLRISETLRLRIEDVNLSTRTISVRCGKGQKDGTGFFGAETAQALRSWLQVRREAMPEDFLFIDKRGRALSRNYGSNLLHRLSVREVTSESWTSRSPTLCCNFNLEADRRPGVGPAGTSA
jgi:site-specific recombinase XerD